MIIIFGNIIITILIITTVTIINEAMRIHSQPSMQFAEDLEPRLEKKEDEQCKKHTRNIILYYSNLDYETVFNTLNAKMVDRNDIVSCAGHCYY